MDNTFTVCCVIPITISNSNNIQIIIIKNRTESITLEMQLIMIGQLSNVRLIYLLIIAGSKSNSACFIPLWIVFLWQGHNVHRSVFYFLPSCCLRRWGLCRMSVLRKRRWGAAWTTIPSTRSQRRKTLPMPTLPQEVQSETSTGHTPPSSHW